MKINLFRSGDCKPEVLTDVYNLLSNFRGPMEFIMKPESTDFEEFTDSPADPYLKVQLEETSYLVCNDFNERFSDRKTIKWSLIFEECQNLRKQHDLGKDEFVILLTSYNNDLNWFSAGNPLGPRDHFVHTEDWDFFLGSDRRFPIAYQIASGVLKKFIFRDYRDLGMHWHQEARGCMLDFCQDKREISLKVRTGDICPDCLRLFDERKAPASLVGQVFEIFDGIRSSMLFKNRYRINRQLPYLHIQGAGKDLMIPEYGNLSIHLSPLEKTLYLFFLRHEAGVMLSHLPDYADEIRAIYSSISGADSQARIESRVSELVDPRSNSSSEKISKIKRKFISAVGEDLAAEFLISGANGKPKKISFDRSRLVLDE